MTKPPTPVDYLNVGWAITPIKPGSKRPYLPGWNKKANAITTAEQLAALRKDRKNKGCGWGLAHLFSGTCSLDGDDAVLARSILRDAGIDSDELRAAPDAVGIDSGKPNRFKLLFLLPDGVSFLPHVTRGTHPERPALELRCADNAESSQQDVLPPTIHPETKVPYAWCGAGDWRKPPVLPDALLQFWLRLAAQDDTHPKAEHVSSPDGGGDVPNGWTARRPRIVAALARLPAPGFKLWQTVAYALHHGSGGSEDGFALFEEWSRGGILRPGPAPQNYKDADDCRKVWDRIRNDAQAKAVTLGTLFALADQYAQRDKPTEDAAEVAEHREARSQRLVWYQRVDDIKESPALVQRIIGVGTSVVAYGAPKTSKTFLLMDMGLHIAAGKPWRGRRTRQGLVLWIAGEGAASVYKRIRAFKQDRPGWAAGCPKGLPFVVLPMVVNFLVADEADRLIEVVRAAEEESGHKCGMIVIDTLAKAMPGGNENSPEDMGPMLANAGRVRELTGATTVFIHHAGKDLSKGARGHTSLKGDLDTEIKVEGEDGVRTMEVTAQRDFESGARFSYTLRTIQLGVDEYGEPVTSCVVDHSDDVVKEIIVKKLKGPRQKQFVEAMRKAAKADPKREWTLEELRKLGVSLDKRKPWHRNTAANVVDSVIAAGYMKSLGSGKHLWTDGVDDTVSPEPDRDGAM